MPLPADLVGEGVGVGVGVGAFEEGVGVGDLVEPFKDGVDVEDDEPKKDDLDEDAADEETGGLPEELVVFELLADEDVGVGVELATLDDAPGVASNSASTQYDLPAVKPEHSGPMLGFWTGQLYYCHMK
jgi:hypothetical protein